eukprot:gene2068-2388_t
MADINTNREVFSPTLVHIPKRNRYAAPGSGSSQQQGCGSVGISDAGQAAAGPAGCDAWGAASGLQSGMMPGTRSSAGDAALNAPASEFAATTAAAAVAAAGCLFGEYPQQLDAAQGAGSWGPPGSAGGACSAAHLGLFLASPDKLGCLQSPFLRCFSRGGSGSRAGRSIDKEAEVEPDAEALHAAEALTSLDASRSPSVPFTSPGLLRHRHSAAAAACHPMRQPALDLGNQSDEEVEEEEVERCRLGE